MTTISRSASSRVAMAGALAPLIVSWATPATVHMPVVDQELRPIGMLSALDMLQVLLQDIGAEEAMLRDYVMGVGYR